MDITFQKLIDHKSIEIIERRAWAEITAIQMLQMVAIRRNLFVYKNLNKIINSKRFF